jgi:hypothetical protein
MLNSRLRDGLSTPPTLRAQRVVATSQVNHGDEAVALQKRSLAAGRGAHKHYIAGSTRHPADDRAFKAPGVPSLRVEGNERTAC